MSSGFRKDFLLWSDSFCFYEDFPWDEPIKKRFLKKVIYRECHKRSSNLGEVQPITVTQSGNWRLEVVVKRFIYGIALAPPSERRITHYIIVFGSLGAHGVA